MANDLLGTEIRQIRERGPTPPHHLAGRYLVPCDRRVFTRPRPEAEIGPPHKRPSVGGSRPYARLVLISARIVHHGRYVDFQRADVAVPRVLFAAILRRIDPLRPRPLLP
jgi:hypothetical protein